MRLRDGPATLAHLPVLGAHDNRWSIIGIEDVRQAVIAAAAALFSDLGYRNTGMHHIVERAKVGQDACYRHFPDKDAVAAAVIAEADVRTRDVIVGVMSMPASALENLILATLVATDMAERDGVVRAANILHQILQVRPAAPDAFQSLFSMPETAIKTAIFEGDLLDDTDVDALAHTIRAAVLGSRLMSDAPAGGLAQVWRIVLRGNVPAHKLDHFEGFVNRMAQQY